MSPAPSRSALWQTRRLTSVAAAGLAASLAAGSPSGQERLDVFTASRDHPAIAYGAEAQDNPVARLNEALAAGSTRLRFGPANGYLPSVLEALHVPVQSQSVVFSETSAQADRITMSNPRAIYFNEEVAVGWVRGAEVLELAAHDRTRGAVFYVLEQREQAAPRFTRRQDCLVCHQTWETLGVPGFQVLSTFPMSDDPRAYASGRVVDHRTPHGERWGGWFVTGGGPDLPHLGNRPVIVPARDLAEGRRPTLHLDSLAGRFDLAGFSVPCSDIVALNVLAHQAHAANLITRLGWEVRVARAAQGHAGSSADRASGRAATGNGRPDLEPRVREAIDDLAAYLVFADEAPLPVALEGGCGFREAFEAGGVADAQGRSLRTLDLRTRLFRYPISYMVYAPAFEALDADVRRLVFTRMLARLGDDAPHALETADERTARRAALDILRSTRRDVP